MKLRTYCIPLEIINEGINQGKIELQKREKFENQNRIIETYKVLSDFAQIGDDWYMRGGLFEREVVYKKELELELEQHF